ncbi:hypothetical protein [Bradyrhizobium paxllaeri]|uniref:hypothetical protein n=1 Tax=Bradyrhizobium paxllaeri TaxID=190148 RepID=UPI000AE690EA|nr:hypothetical protein [Bradyrhizobium paxllaeri]
MAIKKLVPNPNPSVVTPDTVTIPSFSFSPNDGLAEMIVEAWSNEDFRSKLLERETPLNPGDSPKPTDIAVQIATSSVNARGFNLKRAVVISELEHDRDNYVMQDANEVVFVLPDQTRIGTPFASRSSLLDTARLLMACTPNGI